MKTKSLFSIHQWQAKQTPFFLFPFTSFARFAQKDFLILTCIHPLGWICLRKASKSLQTGLLWWSCLSFQVSLSRSRRAPVDSRVIVWVKATAYSSYNSYSSSRSSGRCAIENATERFGQAFSFLSFSKCIFVCCWLDFWNSTVHQKITRKKYLIILNYLNIKLQKISAWKHKGSKLIATACSRIHLYI